MSTQYLSRDSGDSIAYCSSSTSLSSKCGVVVCNGFRSSMTGRKALTLSKEFENVIRFDYRGHGDSSGDFESLSLSDWIDDALKIVDRLTKGPQVLVGSSMGAWIALHVAILRPERIVGIVGIASAPDFTILLWNNLTDTQRTLLKTSGVVHIDSQYSDDPYTITENLLEDAKQWLVLDDKSSVPVTCPVHLLHGKLDVDIPCQYSTDLAKLLESSEVQVTLIENGDHRLSGPNELAHIVSAVRTMIDKRG